MEYTQEQLKAAYALNLCTVSVSQIIDYDDINIMEQEYEAILNNLNIEEMPKDEALLKILKQILDTITFFRIQEKEKDIIEEEYQQKVKNAIWGAVPNIGMIITGMNPISMGLSLATSVGMGYMNYRNIKADAKLDVEKQQWELEKTAMEQFNGLRRELFDTAWRLAAVYNFPDELRLTERQIAQYNNILMDSDLLRRYARLETIQGSFIAYPPFWYHFGNAANLIATSDLELYEETRSEYKLKAVSHFKHYREVNQKGLLREDSTSASCTLEYVELLDFNTDQELISELLDEAVRYSGRSNDVLQIAAVNYLKLKDGDKAVVVLKQLVNEEYNTIMNAQILSSLYSMKYLQSKQLNVLADYDILKNQVGTDYLFPLISTASESVEEVNQSFIEKQRRNLHIKYMMVLDKFNEKYRMKFGKIIPVYSPSEENIIPYFDGSTTAFQNRKYEAQKIFSNVKSAKEYVEILDDSYFKYSILDVLNEMFESSIKFDFVNELLKEKLASKIADSIVENKDLLNDLEDRLKERTFDVFNMEELLKINLMTFSKTFFDELISSINAHVESIFEMQDFAISEQSLTDFCIEEGFPLPNELFGKDGDSEIVQTIQTDKRFHEGLLSDEVQVEKNVTDHINKMVNLIQQSTNTILHETEGVNLYLLNDPRIARFFRGKFKISKNGRLMTDTIALLENENANFDLLFTVYGIVPVRAGMARAPIPYKEIKIVEGDSPYFSITGKYEVAGLNYTELHKVFLELDKYAAEIPKTQNSNNLFGFIKFL